MGNIGASACGCLTLPCLWLSTNRLGTLNDFKGLESRMAYSWIRD